MLVYTRRAKTSTIKFDSGIDPAAHVYRPARHYDIIPAPAVTDATVHRIKCGYGPIKSARLHAVPH